MKLRLRRAGGGLLFLLLLALAVAYAGGLFGGERVAPGLAPPPPASPAPPRTARVERAVVPVRESAVGTVRSRNRVEIGAQITARVVDVATDVGARVEAGALLARLDDRELAARLEQARQARAAAEAAKVRAAHSKARHEALLAQARSRYDRVRALIAEEAATQQQLDDAEADFLAAQAALADAVAAIAAADAQSVRAEQVVAEAEVALGYARITAPLTGVVVERAVDPGDLAWSGRTLFVVFDPAALRLEAAVREGLIATVRPGDRLALEVAAADLAAEGTVAEIIPSADPRSRTFTVRLNFAFREGVYPGMFGRMYVEVGTREVVRMPAAAVRRVGQLETVLVRDGARFVRRYVTTGAGLGDGAVEVLSGLAGGEEVALPAEGS